MPTIFKYPKKKKKKRNVTDAKKEAQKVYNTSRWKKLRMEYLQCHPLCETCLEKQITQPACHIHHKVPFSKGKTDAERELLAFDYANLQALCAHCHEEKHNKHRKWWK